MYADFAVVVLRVNGENVCGCRAGKKYKSKKRKRKRNRSNSRRLLQTDSNSESENNDLLIIYEVWCKNSAIDSFDEETQYVSNEEDTFQKLFLTEFNDLFDSVQK